MIFPTFCVVENTADNTFIGVNGWNQESSGETEAASIMPINCVLKAIYVQSDTNPGSGNTITFTVRKNGADTGLVVSESGTSQTSGSDFDSISYSMWDTAALKMSWTNTPTLTRHRITFIWKTQNNESFMSGGCPNTILDLTTYFPFCGFDIGNGQLTEFFSEMLIPGNFTMKNLIVRLSTAPGLGDSRIFTVRKNSTTPGTPISVTISQGFTSGIDSTNTMAVVGGDAVALQHTFTATPAATNVRYSIAFVAANKGQFIIAENTQDNTSSSTQFFVAAGTFPFMDTTSGHHYEVVRNYIKCSRIWTEQQFGTINFTRTQTLIVNGVASALSKTVTQTLVSGFTDAVVNLVPGDTIHMRTVPGGIGPHPTPAVHTALLAEVKAIQDPILPAGIIPFRRTS